MIATMDQGYISYQDWTKHFARITTFNLHNHTMWSWARLQVFGTWSPHSALLHPSAAVLKELRGTTVVSQET